MPSIRRLTLLPALALMATACSGDSEPSATVTSSPDPTTALAASPEPTAAPSVAAAATQAAAATPAAEAAIAAVTGDPRPAPELVDLVNPDGSTFDLADYRGNPTLLFFGYTHCPDVCPATIGELYGVFEEMPHAQAVFVSVDPERDTPEFLTEWTKYMHDNFNAVTGSPGAIRRAADDYGVKYARVETSSTTGYTMSHTADLYLIDTDGRLLHTYPFGTPAAEIAADIARL